MFETDGCVGRKAWSDLEADKILLDLACRQTGKGRLEAGNTGGMVQMA